MQTMYVDQLKINMLPALKSKVEEFQLMGYDGISDQQIWDSLYQNIWKKEPPQQTHRVVKDIMEFTINTYMDFKQADALKHTKVDLAQSIKALT